MAFTTSKMSMFVSQSTSQRNVWLASGTCRFSTTSIISMTSNKSGAPPPSWQSPSWRQVHSRQSCPAAQAGNPGSPQVSFGSTTWLPHSGGSVEVVDEVELVLDVVVEDDVEEVELLVDVEVVVVDEVVVVVDELLLEVEVVVVVGGTPPDS